MNPSRPKTGLVAAGCILALLVAFTPRLAMAAPARQGNTTVRAINLHLDAEAARVALAESGAAQEADSEKPRSMDTPAPPATATDGTGATSSVAAQPRPAGKPDKFGFVKEWPFWVIVGGVLIAGIATYMIVRNSNTEAPCADRFNGGCWGSR
jgi:hypothetical protein